ncbi:MAG: leucine-rich repeat domain-containing protein [Lachnospiraceae bacterium]|nr:leucine-rich repeat domain-containing protein [Lachnospiraceae bacterium]MBQ8877485.1 leucine-rich repeat domain-containing protein [Lachnospiraceae bacterium]
MSMPCVSKEKTEKIIIPEGTTRIDDCAFEGCEALREVILPSTLQEIGGRAFNGCSNLEKIVLPPALTFIGGNAFKDCVSLRLLVLPCIEGVCSTAFVDCKDLALVLPDGSFIMAEEFEPWPKRYNPWERKWVYGLPVTYTEVPNSCFAWCYWLNEIELHGGITKIGDEAFRDCTDLHYLGIPSLVTEIGEGAFRGSAIVQIVIPESVTSIAEDAFDERVYEEEPLEELMIFGKPGSYAQEYAIAHGFDFHECDGSWETTPPELPGQTDRAETASQLPDILLPTDASDPCKRVWTYGRLNKIEIPEGVRKIAPNALKHNYFLTEVMLPTTLAEIGEEAFEFCSKLKIITIPEGVVEIGERAFASCAMQEITIPEGVVKIGAKAFDIQSLTEIVLPASVTEIGKEAFGRTELFGVVVFIKTIHAPAGSYAEKYALENGFRFEAI